MTVRRTRAPGVGDQAARKRRTRGRLAVFGVLLGALLVGINLASAVTLGGFEIDAGDVAQNHALYSGTDSPPGDDWAQGPGQQGIFASAGAGNCYGSEIHSVVQPSTVICDGNSDSKFRTTQPEQTIVSPSGKTQDDVWPIKPGNVRPKNDFSHAYVHANLADSPCDQDPDANNLILQLGGHVGDNEGSHFWGFEFDRTAPGGFDKLKLNNGAQFDLDFNRQIGDLLISFTVPGNANDQVLVEVFQVTGFNPNGSAIFTLAAVDPGCTDPDFPQGLTRLATNQSNDVEAPPWNVPVCDPTADNGANTCRLANGTTDSEDLLAPRDFAEASVDLRAFGITNPCFTNVIFTSRSSHVLEGADIQDVGGGDFPLCGTKSGVKFHDHNANGVKNVGDEGLNGWTMKLYGDANGDGILQASEATALQTKVTATVNGVDGFYAFNNLQNGDYIVCEVLQDTWHQSLPNSGSSELADCTSQSGDATLGPNGYAFTMSGADQPGNDFGNFQNATVSGMKFKDADADGVKDASEIGLGGWEIHVFGTSAQGAAIHQHATTVSNGTYSVVVPPGTYTVCETITDHTGWFQSFPTSGTSCTGHTGAAPLGYSVTPTSGGTVANRDFGNKPASKIKIDFLPQAKLPDGTTDATRATSISCSDGSSSTNSNTLTTGNVFTNQSAVTCTITFVDP
jgi:SdrD B-like domain